MEKNKPNIVKDVLEEMQNYMMSHLEISNINNCIKEALMSEIAFVKKDEADIITCFRVVSLRDLVGYSHFYYPEENSQNGRPWQNSMIKASIRLCLEELLHYQSHLLTRNIFEEVLIDNGFEFRINQIAEQCESIPAKLECEALRIELRF